jgi:hypothetical protein
MTFLVTGFTDPINVKFANTPNAVKSMIGLPLAPSYIPGIPTPQQPVLTTIPPIRQQLNRYRYAARFMGFLFSVARNCFFSALSFFAKFIFSVFIIYIILHRETHERSKYR